MKWRACLSACKYSQLQNEELRQLDGRGTSCEVVYSLQTTLIGFLSNLLAYSLLL